MSRLQQHRAGVPSANQRTRFKGFRGVGTWCKPWRHGEGPMIVVAERLETVVDRRSGRAHTIQVTDRARRHKPKFGRVR